MGQAPARIIIFFYFVFLCVLFVVQCFKKNCVGDGLVVPGQSESLRFLDFFKLDPLRAADPLTVEDVTAMTVTQYIHISIFFRSAPY